MFQRAIILKNKWSSKAEKCELQGFDTEEELCGKLLDYLVISDDCVDRISPCEG